MPSMVPLTASDQKSHQTCPFLRKSECFSNFLSFCSTQHNTYTLDCWTPSIASVSNSLIVAFAFVAAAGQVSFAFEAFEPAAVALLPLLEAKEFDWFVEVDCF